MSLIYGNNQGMATSCKNPCDDAALNEAAADGIKSATSDGTTTSRMSASDWLMLRDRKAADNAVANDTFGPILRPIKFASRCRRC